MTTYIHKLEHAVHVYGSRYAKSKAEKVRARIVARALRHVIRTQYPDTPLIPTAKLADPALDTVVRQLVDSV